MNYLMRALGGVLLLGYGTTLIGGYEFSSHQKTQIAPNVRQSPGGYRSWSFWHSGSGGGK
ncbi:hypothetical protein LVJ94_15835 [Pendulispora rubella]|uniref:Uncharacterized protein n=1 Tax=Pendulispora rubella TaxID=2741070 RepID=A0ABZ2LHS3_9BACT